MDSNAPHDIPVHQSCPATRMIEDSTTSLPVCKVITTIKLIVRIPGEGLQGWSGHVGGTGDTAGRLEGVELGIR